jgi:hypothetical protein
VSPKRVAVCMHQVSLTHQLIGLILTPHSSRNHPISLPSFSNAPTKPAWQPGLHSSHPPRPPAFRARGAGQVTNLKTFQVAVPLLPTRHIRPPHKAEMTSSGKSHTHPGQAQRPAGQGTSSRAHGTAAEAPKRTETFFGLFWFGQLPAWFDLIGLRSSDRLTD